MKSYWTIIEPGKKPVCGQELFFYLLSYIIYFSRRENRAWRLVCGGPRIVIDLLTYTILEPRRGSTSGGASRRSPPLATPLPYTSAAVSPSRESKLSRPSSPERRTAQKNTPATPFPQVESLDTSKPPWFATWSYVDSFEKSHHGFPSALPKSRLGAHRREDTYAA